MTDFYKLPTSQTVFTSTGTAFKTPEEFFSAGGAQDFSNVQTVDTLPFTSASTLSGQNVPLPNVNIPQTIPIPPESTAPQPSLEELFSQYRTEAGLPALTSQRQQFQQSAFDILKRTREGLTAQEGKGIEQDISISKQRELSRLAERELTPILQGLQLTQEQIKEVNEAVSTRLGLISKEREFGAGQEQQRFDNLLKVYDLGKNAQKYLGSQVDDDGNVSVFFQKPDGTFGFKTIGKIAKEKQDKKIAEEIDDNGNLTIVFQKPDGTMYNKTIQGVGKTKTEPVNKYEIRDSEAEKILQAGKGTDGYVSAEIYQSALRKYISLGGNQANFISSFPQQTYLRELERDKLPAALRPQQVPSTKTLAPAQLSYINDAKAELDAWKQSHPFQDFSAAREFLVNQVKSQYGFDIGPFF